MCPRVIRLPTCQNCGEFVTSRFARVFGDNSGEVFGCFGCTSYETLAAGAGATADQ